MIKLKQILVESIQTKYKNWDIFYKNWKDDQDQYFLKDFKEYNSDKYSQKLKKDWSHFINTIEKYPNPFEIYRAIQVENGESYLKNFDSYSKKHGMGIFWSWNEEKASIYWNDSENGDVVILTAKVNKQNVDWDNTILANMNLQTMTESEITLKKSIPIFLTHMTMKNKTYKINKRVYS